MDHEAGLVAKATESLLMGIERSMKFQIENFLQVDIPEGQERDHGEVLKQVLEEHGCELYYKDRSLRRTVATARDQVFAIHVNAKLYIHNSHTGEGASLTECEKNPAYDEIIDEIRERLGYEN